ncbi:MAG: hypothetical protein J6Y03_04770 [Alphaproteobacteria bacterium]|nr:hypothetical protein [Alphaproteobacteria bacterium]
MGKFNRFLSALLLAVCLLTPVFVSSNVFANISANEDCGEDCAHLTDSQRKKMAEGVLLGQGDELSDFRNKYATRGYCDVCYDETKKVLALAEKIYKEQNNSGCMNICLQRMGQSVCESRCGEAPDRIAEWRLEANECHKISGWQDDNHSGFMNVVTEIVTFGTDHWVGRNLDAGNSLGAKYNSILSDYLGYDGGGCWFCPIFDLVFNSVNKLATMLYINLRSICLAFLGILGFGWILWTVFRLITTIHGPNIGEFMTKVFKNLLLWSILAIILWAQPSFITRYIIDPFATFGTQVSMSILAAEGLDNDSITITKYETDTFQCGMTKITYNGVPHTTTRKICNRKPSNSNDFVFNANGGNRIQMSLSADVYNDMNCMLRRMSIELIGGVALGAAIMSEGMSGGKYDLPRWGMLFAGLLIFLSFFALLISVPLKLIDLLLRLGFVIILLPIFIACMATPITREYSKKGWEMFISCWISLISLFLFISLALMMVNTALLMDS